MVEPGRWLWRIVIGLLVATLITILLIVGIWFKVTGDEARTARGQQSATQALCSLRDDLQKRVQSGNQFLKAHPRGIPGVPVATIRTSIANEQHTLTALKPLVCTR